MKVAALLLGFLAIFGLPRVGYAEMPTDLSKYDVAVRGTTFVLYWGDAQKNHCYAFDVLNIAAFKPLPDRVENEPLIT